MRRAVIVDSVRTGISRAFQGRLAWTRPDDMAAHCVDRLLERNPGIDPASVDDCVIGCAFPEGPQGMNLGRNVALLSRLSKDVAGVTVSRYCASGVDAVAHAASRIASGCADVILAGGVESVSMTMRNVNTTSLFNPRLEREAPGVYLRMDIHNPSVTFWKRAFRSMGETAELIAERQAITREAQDAYASRSQRRTARAQEAGLFQGEIAPLEVKVQVDIDDRGEPVFGDGIVERDDCNRPDTTVEGLGLLQPSFRDEGTVTAGNASQLGDGASCCLLASEEVAGRLGLGGLGYFLGYAVAGCEPERMAAGPVLAIPKLLRARGLSMDDVDLFEINEAFAAQMIHCLRELDLDEDRVNVNGGAISIGHPFGMTGSRQVGHLLRELRRRKGRYGVVAACVGGGMGVAALVEAT